ncbi:MAG: NADP-reducing hydrogenase subunit HndC [Pelotomaculum sp. PtaB.Bin013]|uniref:NADH-quinone oxidoreductase subunit NuoF n=1 Tax=Pelotomaculum isophthalicicum JI TaxID=947010 RepID=A0A9X4GZ77_9FIRM|nr:NADH-quinone oxidoreductase subunit NuoF [Pelotomaculum isophthalicicum]MDF9408435.1 NADH-quinone oxidoreductase subunit NuoF [Pelotomaculum isophthalicicum JI]OPX91687.1 MAG: NADP-reducing hydrogenase subunit HndC [Pelotomaculum sp. PtaB.Bin013]
MQFYRSHVLVCSGSACVLSGCQTVKEALAEGIKKQQLDNEIQLIETGCMGLCDLGPRLIVYPEGVVYCRVTAEDAEEIVNEHLLKGRIVERLVYRDPETQKPIPFMKDFPFLSKQTKIALRNAGLINPEDIEEYIGCEGYSALAKALSMSPGEVIAELKKSGLRGRGGAGFPTGLKWEFTAKANATQKYVVCNGDEGDPGAFMDRSVLEGDPHSVIEAMAIAGYTVGASKGYIYVRAEYPLAVERLRIAINQAREYGLLGEDILGKGFNFDLNVRVGAGAFVCGEETALLASIEGRRGEPRPRPPFPATEGLWGKPTLLNNVETYASIAPIILNGGDWYASRGTEKSRGTKVFALTGKVNNTGLIEVPMGIPLGEIIYDIGGGIMGGKKFKAAQTGGPSGGCIPVDHLNVGVDYESLAELGAIVGSGGLIVMDEDTCMVDLAKFFTEFCQEESCGKCAPCRIGTKRMLEILERITRGEGEEGDIERLIELCEYIKSTALCGLGQTAPNPVLSTIRYFRHEYEAHIRDKRCPASVCASLFNSPCQNTCPAGVDIPIYLDHIRNGRFYDAYMEVKRENPFPAVCGRVCHHPCEGKCNRAKLDEPLAVRALKRYAADWVYEQNKGFPVEPPGVATGKQVAIIGGGPAGLTAAYYLAKVGHRVTVFESLPFAGGMLKVGIPDYRLPAKTLAAEIKAIEGMGVTIKTNTRFGKDVTFADLEKQGFNAVFIAVGAHADQKLGVPGEELNGVISGINYLRDVKLGQAADVEGKTVLVVGGGNVAIDSARSAVRNGAKEVQVVYRRRKEDMPAFEDEIMEAEHEGVKFIFMTAPISVQGAGGQVTGLECQQSVPGDFDKSGRRRPVPVEDSNFVIPADVVIAAIGQNVQLDGITDAGVQTVRGLVAVDPDSMATNIPYIFAGGDCASGPDTAIGAIAHGKKAAAAIDKYLGGSGVVVEPRDIKREVSGEVIEDKRAREIATCLPVADRKSFAEVENGFTKGQAMAEAMRCLRCDVK